MAGHAHLVGGLAFETGEEAMRAVGENAADAVDWVPDGETGQRRKWMSQHRVRFEAEGALELKAVTMTALLSPETRGGQPSAGMMLYGLKAGRTAADVGVDSLGYVEPALESYRLFSQLKVEGLLRPEARFQVSLPTPFGVFTAFVHPNDRDALRPVVEHALFNDVTAIAAAVPHDQLAFQWDVAYEFGVLTGAHPTQLADPLGAVIENIVRAGQGIPADIPVGYHLCYGAAYDVHFLEPEDTGLMAQVMRGVLERLDRPVARFHIPVPINRDDVAYYEPLRDLDLGSTRLYLGLVHHEDDVEGARRRIAAAKQVVPEFGVATECGSGRTLTDPVALLRLHSEAARIAAEPADPSIEPPRKPRPQPPIDPAAVNDRLRRIAEQVKCTECDAEVGEPCDGDPSGRPHMDRYHEAMLGIIAGRLAPVD